MSAIESHYSPEMPRAPLGKSVPPDVAFDVEPGMCRVLDIILSVAFMVAAAPFLLLVAIAIRLDSKGPVLFLQTRYGKNRVPFRILKFRSMCVQEDGAAVRQVIANDPRVTRIGRFLRATSIDEVPQLINVLRGEMSLVGPRPHAMIHDDALARKVPDYDTRFRVRPGITGLAQVEGYRGPTVTDAEIHGRLRAHIHFVEHQSLGLYLRILLKTVPAVFRQTNAF